MSSWRECKLGEVAFFQRGHDLPKTQMNDGLIPVAGSNGIIGFHDKSTTKAPGITIGRSGNIGIPKFYNQEFWAHNTVLYVKDFKGNDEKFVFYLLNTIDLSGFNSGSAVPTLNRNHIHEIDMRVPPLEEQKAIAEVLSSLDDKIDLLHRQNLTLESLAQTLFRQWFEDKEYDGIVGDIVKLQSGYAFKSKDFQDNGNHGVLKIKNISNSIIDIFNTDFIDSNVANKTDEKFRVLSGDILFGMTGAEIGKMGIVPQTDKNLWLNQRVGVLKEKYLGAKYLAYLQITSEFGYDYIVNTASGSAQPNISANEIEQCPFVKLTEDEIKNYSNEISPLFEKIVFNLGQIQTLENLRDTLLPKLLSGEVIVTI